MKTTLTRTHQSSSSPCPKAIPELLDRTPKASPPRSLLDHARASWTAVPRRRDRFCFTVLALLTLLSLAPRAAAQGRVPERMTFQGFMEDASGVPLGQSAPENLPVVFRMYPSATGGVSSWAERQTVTFDMGRYSVLLGSGAAEDNEPHGKFSELLQANPGAQLFVETEVTINGTPARITPRLRLVASPYSLLATRALSAESAESADSAATLTGTLPVQQLSGSLLATQLADDAVTEDKIRNGAVTSGKIANFSVLASKIAPGAVWGEKIATGGINTSNIGPSAVTESKIADDAVSSRKIKSLDASKLAGTLSAARLPGVAARTDAANTFTANQTMNANLTVVGALNLGPYKPAVGEESLRIVRGRVKLIQGGAANVSRFDYEAVSPVGFSVREKTPYRPIYDHRDGDNTRGVAEITFDPPFADIPAVTVTPWMEPSSLGGLAVQNNRPVSAIIHEITTTRAVVSFIDHENAGYRFDSPFTFIAVGER